MKLKEKLSVLRTEQGLTQNELALKVNVSRQSIYKWERGTATPTTENLISLSRLYGVPLDELISEGPPVAAEPEAPPASGKRWAKIAVCLLLSAVAVITIWSVVFKGSEAPGDKIVWTDDITPEYIDPAEVIPFDGEVKMIDDGVIQFGGTVPGRASD